MEHGPSTVRCVATMDKLRTAGLSSAEYRFEGETLQCDAALHIDETDWIYSQWRLYADGACREGR